MWLYDKFNNMRNRFIIIAFVCFVVFNIFHVLSVEAQSAVSSPVNADNSSVSSSPRASVPANANTNSGQPNPEYTNINSSKFRLLICDGPAELIAYNPATRKIEPGFKNPDFIPCDFRGLMMQIQHLINIAMTVGVLFAVAGLLFAGYLYISGKPANISRAHDIFPSLAKGFIIMLAAWFIVYQILEWLTGTNGYGVLLGL